MLPPLPLKFIHKDPRDQLNKTEHTIVYVMREWGYTPEEMAKVPIPTFVAMVHMLQKEKEEYDKANKKSGKSRH